MFPYPTVSKDPRRGAPVAGPRRAVVAAAQGQPGGAIAQSKQDDVDALARLRLQQQAQADEHARQRQQDKAQQGVISQLGQQQQQQSATNAAWGKTGNPGPPPAVAQLGTLKPGRPAAPAQQQQDPLTEMAQLRLDQAAEKKAKEEELAVNRAKALEGVGARAGLGGLGLSGASAALQTDTARAYDRSNTLALADFTRAQTDQTRAQSEQEWQTIQRQAALSDLEDAQNADLNGDGVLGSQGTGADQAAARMEQLHRLEVQMHRDLDGNGTIGGGPSPLEQAKRDAIESPSVGLSFEMACTDGTFDYYRNGRGGFAKVRR